MTVNAGSNRKNKSLTRVISTKLSIEDYERFQKCKNFVYEAGAIEAPSTSQFLRFIVTHPFKVVRAFRIAKGDCQKTILYRKHYPKIKGFNIKHSIRLQ